MCIGRNIMITEKLKNQKYHLKTREIHFHGNVFLTKSPVHLFLDLISGFAALFVFEGVPNLLYKIPALRESMRKFNDFRSDK